MELVINRNEEETTARLVGRLDTLASQEIAAGMKSLEEDAGGRIVLDCEDLTYISSSGLRLFLSLRKAVAASGGKLVVRKLRNEIRSVFMMTGFLSLFVIE